MSSNQSYKIVFFSVLLLGALFLVVTPYVLPSAVIGLVTFYFYAPLIHQIQNKLGWGWKKSAQIVFILSSILLILALVLAFPFVQNQMTLLGQEMPILVNQFLALIPSWDQWLTQNFGFSISGQAIRVTTFLFENSSKLLSSSSSYLSGSLAFLFLAPMFSYFIVTEGPSWTSGFKKMVPPSYLNFFETILILWDQQLGGFIRARIIESIIISILTAFGLYLLEIPFSFLLGLLAGVLNIIPYIGPVISFIPVGLLALGQPNPMQILVLSLALYLLVQVVDGVILVPFLVAKIVRLHPLVVISAILLGGHLLGALGMIISIPLAGAANILLAHFLKKH